MATMPGTWVVRRVIARGGERCAPDLAPTRRVRGSGSCPRLPCGLDGPCCRSGGIRRIARESIAYQDESPYLYRKMLWSRYNEATT